MKHALWGLLLAFQFLTRVPIPVSLPWNRETMRWALRAYPLVGLFIGAILCTLIVLLTPYVPVWMLALLLVSIWIALTGGLHLDGWMDVADAVGSNAPVEKKWTIMKDPHVGSFAIIALLFLLVWKWAFVYVVVDLFNELYLFFNSQQYLFSPLNDTPSGFILVALLLIPAVARLGAVCILYFVPAAKKEGLAWEWKKHITLWDVFIAALPVVLIVCLYPLLFVGLVAYSLYLMLKMLWMQKTFGGINGDIAGASIEGGEWCALLIMSIYILFVMA